MRLTYMGGYIKVIFKYKSLLEGFEVLTTLLNCKKQDGGPYKCESLYVCPQTLTHFWMR
jgi:hypothetical protein